MGCWGGITVLENGACIRKITTADGLPWWDVRAMAFAPDGTLWAGLFADPGQAFGVRAGQARCSVPDGGFGGFVWSLGEDASGSLWVGAESGVWQWRPGTRRRPAMPGMRE